MFSSGRFATTQNQAGVRLDTVIGAWNCRWCTLCIWCPWLICSAGLGSCHILLVRRKWYPRMMCTLVSTVYLLTTARFWSHVVLECHMVRFNFSSTQVFGGVSRNFRGFKEGRHVGFDTLRGIFWKYLYYRNVDESFYTQLGRMFGAARNCLRGQVWCYCSCSRI